jgi:hypothetical protein
LAKLPKLYAPAALAVVVPTVAPPEFFSVTVAAAPPPPETGVIVPEIVYVDWLITTVPPVAEALRLRPGGVAETAFKTCTEDEVLLVVAEIVNVIVAMTPLAIARLLTPDRTQVGLPAMLLQIMDFPAAIAAAPAVTVTAVKSDVE